MTSELKDKVFVNHTPSKECDFHNLLLKYMTHVGDIEGTLFLGKSASTSKVFTKEELVILRELEDELNKII